ncbi:MAG TPA: hypothetical protein VLC54_15005 [Anaeromyxobacter sp.]|nr:hypothetical protein [Anaeromyxobacter sp.]
MRKTLAVAAALLAACEAQVQTDAESFRSALPEESAIRIATPAPAPSATASAAEVIAAAPAFGSEYARVTFWTASTVNSGIAWSLARLRLVVSSTPTTCDALTCTWGPWTDRESLNEWRLVARQDGAGWAYALDARPGSPAVAEFAPIVAGVAYPGAQPGRGKGSFLVDFDAAASLEHGADWLQEDFGRVEVRYDASATSVDAIARGVRSRDPEDPVFMDAAYAYRATAAGGELQLALETLEESPRNLSLRSRWDASGAGRGDARWISAGLEYVASECWSGAASGFALVYDSDGVPADEGACGVFVPALPATVTLP